MNTVSPTAPVRHESFFGIIGDLREDAKLLLTKELSLFKTELKEKFSKMGKDSGYLAAGGVIALMGAIILLLSLGFIIAYALQTAGLSDRMAEFLGFLTVAVLTCSAGAVLAMKGLKALKSDSLAPEKALDTIREIRGQQLSAVAKESVKIEQPAPDSNELKNDIEVARYRMDEEVAELKSRLTPKYMTKSFVAGLKHHPLRALLISAGAGASGFLLYKLNHRNGVPTLPKKVHVKVKTTAANPFQPLLMRLSHLARH